MRNVKAQPAPETGRMGLGWNNWAAPLHTQYSVPVASLMLTAWPPTPPVQSFSLTPPKKGR